MEFTVVKIMDGVLLTDTSVLQVHAKQFRTMNLSAITKYLT